MTVPLTCQCYRSVCVRDFVPLVEMDKIRVGDQHRWHEADWIVVAEDSP